MERLQNFSFPCDRNHCGMDTLAAHSNHGIACAKDDGPAMNVTEKTASRDPGADDICHRPEDSAGTPLITRAACMAVFVVAVAEEKGILDAIRLFLL
jgi:hypothetical protein